MTAKQKDEPETREPHPLEGVELPVSTLREALPHLRRPFTPEAVKFKVQTVWPKGANPTGCLVVTYIDARLVIERLNAVVGDLWTAEPRDAGQPKLLWCKLTVDGVTRPDLGESGKGMSKDVWSDSIKRAAVQFGVGVSLYALKQIRLKLAADAARIEKRGDGDRTTLALTDKGHEDLRAGYRKWLAEHGERLFGPVLDHGDVEGQREDFELEVEPDGVEPLTDDRATELHAEIQDAYEKAVAARGPRFMPVGEFKLRVGQVHHDHAAMEVFRDYLRVLAAPREVRAEEAKATA